MNDNRDNSNDTNAKLEQLLTGWGAKQAIDGTNIGDPPKVALSQPSPAAKPLRFRIMSALVGAAAMLLVSGVVFLLIPNSQQGSVTKIGGDTPEQEAPCLSPTPPTPQQELEQLKKQIATMVSREDHEAALAALRSSLQRDHSKTISKMQTAIAQLEQDVNSRALLLKQSEDKLTASQTRVTELAKKLKGSERNKNTLLTELQKNRDLQDRLLADAKQAKSELIATQLQLRGTMDNFRKIYLAAMSPQGDGLAARQKAAEQARIVQRCAIAQRRASNESASELFHKIEVVMTKLELIDPENPAEARSFADLLAKSQLAFKIDRLMAAGSESPDLQALLFETKLILTGVEFVG